MKLSVRCFAILVIFASLLLFAAAGYAYSDRQTYYLGEKTAKAGEIHSAFMYFRDLLTGFPGSKYRQEAMFATGEYYFLVSNYRDALKTFSNFLQEYPDSNNKIFALMYLVKISRARGMEALANELEKNIIGLQQSVFLFKDFKEYKYTSPLSRAHRVICYIDRMEFYVEGELFAKISY